MPQLEDKNYYKLEKFLECEFIPKTIRMKSKINPTTKDIDYSPSIQLRNILGLNYDEENTRHVLEYLSREGILVDGEKPEYFFERLRYINKFDEDLVLKPFINCDFEIFKEYKKTGNVKLREELVKENVGLVKYLSYQFARNTNLNMAEIESYAYEALLIAIDSYDPEINDNFTRYAYTCVRNKLNNSIPYLYGFKMGDFYTKFETAKKDVEEFHGKKLEEDFSLIGEIREQAISKFSKYRDDARNRIDISFHESLSDPENLNIVDNSESMEQEFEIANNYENLHMVINNLPYREQEILKYLFGLKDGKIYTLQQVADLFGLSRERVRVIRETAIKHITNSDYIVSPIQEDDSTLTYGQKL